MDYTPKTGDIIVSVLLYGARIVARDDLRARDQSYMFVTSPDGSLDLLAQEPVIVLETFDRPKVSMTDKAVLMLHCLRSDGRRAWYTHDPQKLKVISRAG